MSTKTVKKELARERKLPQKKKEEKSCEFRRVLNMVKSSLTETDKKLEEMSLICIKR